MNFGSPGVTGSACGNAACEAADLVIGVGTRFQDFTTGSWTVFANPDRRIVSINVHGYDALKHGAIGVVGDAKVTLEKIDAALGDTRFAAADAKAAHRLARRRRRGHRRAGEGREQAPLRRPGDRRGAADGDGEHRRHVRRRHHAGRAAGALAVGQGRLPHGVRLLLHGLRDRRRHGHQARRARRRR